MAERKCTHCGSRELILSELKFVGDEDEVCYINDANTFICTACGHIEWFAPNLPHKYEIKVALEDEIKELRGDINRAKKNREWAAAMAVTKPTDQNGKPIKYSCMSEEYIAELEEDLKRLETRIESYL